jgi:glycosyltransferase involved in cell wall biosynthesis
MENSHDARTITKVDVLVPVYNEETSIQTFHQRLLETLQHLNARWEIIYIDDGSTDETRQILHNIEDSEDNVRILTFSRNFGKEAALTAGMDHCDGDVVVSIDSDGEHPPAMIPEMLKLYQLGYDVVHMQRSYGDTPDSIRKWPSRLFYSMLALLSRNPVYPGVSDFRLISDEVLQAMRGMPEYHRYIRGMVTWLGFRSILLPYEPGPRIAGKSKFSLTKLIKLALDAIFSFSLVPLFIGLFVGLGFLFLAVLEAIYVLQFWIRGDIANVAPGWSSLMFMLLIIGGTTSILLGIIGMYIGYIFQEVKRRPIYVLESANSS